MGHFNFAQMGHFNFGVTFSNLRLDFLCDMNIE